jgi:hypothetical protein
MEVLEATRTDYQLSKIYLEKTYTVDEAFADLEKKVEQYYVD